MHSYTYFYKLGCHNDSIDVHCQAYNMFLKLCNKNMFLVMHTSVLPRLVTVVAQAANGRVP